MNSAGTHDTGSEVLFREPPPSAANQREIILRLLRTAARLGQGVSGDTLRSGYGFPQAPARIWELKNLFGYRIETTQDCVTRLATYHFRGEPPEGWQPSKHLRRKLKTADLTEQSRRNEPSRFEQVHERDIEREAPLFAGGRP